MNVPDRIVPGATGPFVPWAVPEAQMREQVADLRWPHYVYALCTHTGVAFYIGKGRGPRLFDHVREAREGGTSEKCRVIRRLGDRLRYGILLACADEPFALGFEAIHIRWSYDVLTNLAPASEAAIECMFDPLDPDVIALGQLLDVLDDVAEMEAANERAARRLVRSYPWLQPRLFPGEAACRG